MENPVTEIGAYTYAASPIRFMFSNASKIVIGKFCSIANNVTIFGGGEHNTDWITTFPFNVMGWGVEPHQFAHPKTKGGVIIGNDVWIGDSVTILSGVTVGDGAVIGACSLIAKDVEPYAIVVGNPAKVIKKRFSDDVIEKLLTIKWWDWNEEEIKKVIPLLMNNNVNNFIEFCEREGKL